VSSTQRSPWSASRRETPVSIATKAIIQYTALLGIIGIDLSQNFVGIVELADIIEMTDTHPVFETSIPIHSSCLETKTASFDIKNKMSGEVASATGGLLDGDFDVESLLGELTIDEKASLLSGIVAITTTSSGVCFNYEQARTSGTRRKSRD
jgi:hypothetical protein